MDSVKLQHGLSAITSISSCLLLSIIYVSSLYIWNSEHNRYTSLGQISNTSRSKTNEYFLVLYRDHPATIKKRFFSVSIVMLISPAFIYFTSAAQLSDETPLWYLMGFRKAGFWPALIIPLILTSILFLGPLAIQMSNGVWRIYSGE
jgi:prenyl protein peptidase